MVLSTFRSQKMELCQSGLPRQIPSDLKRPLRTGPGFRSVEPYKPIDGSATLDRITVDHLDAAGHVRRCGAISKRTVTNTAKAASATAPAMMAHRLPCERLRGACALARYCGRMNSPGSLLTSRTGRNFARALALVPARAAIDQPGTDAGRR